MLVLAVVLGQDGNGDDLLCGSGNRFDSNNSLLWSGFLGLFNQGDSSINELGVNLLNGYRGANNGSVSMLTNVVGVRSGVGQVGVLDVGNDDALLRLELQP